MFLPKFLKHMQTNCKVGEERGKKYFEGCLYTKPSFLLSDTFFSLVSYIKQKTAIFSQINNPLIFTKLHINEIYLPSFIFYNDFLFLTLSFLKKLYKIVAVLTIKMLSRIDDPDRNATNRFTSQPTSYIYRFLIWHSCRIS